MRNLCIEKRTLDIEEVLLDIVVLVDNIIKLILKLTVIIALVIYFLCLLWNDFVQNLKQLRFRQDAEEILAEIGLQKDGLIESIIAVKIKFLFARLLCTADLIGYFLYVLVVFIEFDAILVRNTYNLYFLPTEQELFKLLNTPVVDILAPRLVDLLFIVVNN